MSTTPTAPETVQTEPQSLADYIRTENTKERESKNGTSVLTAESVPAAPGTDASGGTPAAMGSDESPASVEPEQERNPDGTFKAKPKEAEKKDGDPRRSHQAKINRAIADKSAAERRAEAAEARAAELEAKLNGAAPAKADAPKGPAHVELLKACLAQPDYPKLEDFQGFDDPYAACVAAQSAYVQDYKAQQQAESKKSADAEAELQKRIAATTKAGAEKYKNWDDLFESEAAQVVLPAEVINELYDDETLSADLLHHLLTHPDVMAEAATKNTPIAAARFIAKLSVGLSAAPSGPATAPQSVTKAKPLIKPVSSTPAAPEAQPTVDLPLAQYIRVENARERREREALRGA